MVSFGRFEQALPLITLVLSTISSAFGMTNFFLKGPLPILPNDGPLDGILSIPFGCTLLMNTMFIVRIICIENAFLTSYRYQRYPKNLPSFKDDFLERTIDPIIPPEYRLVAYFTPVVISFTINLIKLVCTGTKLVKCVRKYPQFLIASCFTPFMFEGCDENSIRIWKLGTVLNALFIGCLPQIILLYMEFYRGTVNWDFVGVELSGESLWENNDALFKHRYGNCLFASISGVLYLFLIIFAFKLCSESCFVCPKHLIKFSQIFSLSPTLEITSVPTDDKNDPIFYMNRYSKGSATLITEDRLCVKLTKLKQVDLIFSYNTLES